MAEIISVLIPGSNGQLGKSLQSIASDYPKYDFFFAQRADLDFSDANSIRQFFEQHQFDLIINCAAYTAVDKAETEVELAEQVNHIAVKQLASYARQQQAKLIHISTDYVFNGKQYRPYIETDDVAPQSVYGDTKLKGEQAILTTMSENSVIIRTSWVYSEYGNNFVKTMLRLGSEREAINVIFDQIGTPTYAHDLAVAIMQIVSSEHFKAPSFDSEIFHYSNEGACSWYDFAKAIFSLSQVKCGVTPIETNEYPTAATRPHYSLLNKSKIKKDYNLTIPYWQDSLRQCLNALKENA